MRDLTIRLPHRPGSLAALGRALGEAGASIEGGGAWAEGGQATAHFLFRDADLARRAAEAAGFAVLADREVATLRLDQGRPGQLGRATLAMAEAGVNLEALYSDHDHRLVLVADRPEAARAVAQAWAAPPPGRQHHYRVALAWLGNRGSGTRGYRDYGREHALRAPGKAEIAGSSDPAFRGDAARWNPEELLVASLSACHQLWYLRLCADAGVVVTAYEDEAQGTMVEGPSGGRFSRVVLAPRVTVPDPAHHAQALALHAEAHAQCFVANSVNFPVEVQPTIA